MNKRSFNEGYKLKYDSVFDTYVISEDKSDVSKRDYNFTPRVFAQRFFTKMGEKLLDIDENIEVDFEKSLDEEEKVDRDIKERKEDCHIIFKEGACDDDEVEEIESVKQQQEQERFVVRPPIGPQPPRPPQPPQPPRQPQNQNPAIIAGDIYNKLLVLNLLYRDLRNYNTKFNSDLDEMISELNIITFAMLRIYQTLSRSNRIPLQNQRKPVVRGFCEGVVVTSNYIRGIMFDVRKLQRVVEIQNIDRQLIIINLTLQSQQSQLQEMRQDCIEGGSL